MVTDTSISERAQLLLKHLVNMYIRDGQPIGSKTLVYEAFPQLSPATVRKVLSDLEDRGFISSPHTSAGRVPTTQGIRFFVDSLLSVHPLEEAQAKRMEASLDMNQPTDHIIANTSNVLSELTHMVGIVTLPKGNQHILRHVEFLPLADNRVLAILVFNEREVQNRIIVTEQQYTASELTQASNFLNQYFVGKELFCAREELLKALNFDRLQMDSLMKAVVDVAGKAFVPPPNQGDYVLAGQQNLFANPTASVQQLEKIFKAFTHKQQILHLLDNCLQSEGVQMFIGEESGYDAFRDCSVITSRYTVDGEVVGVLGVIGPTRMRYDKVIPVVEYTAKVLGALLNPDK
ncbi:MAG: heat-inducible transcription repressor HrcA [Proteobacteria bacterium]|nr:heat-inducible transcription repressor HrcA [Pseudomonadota bacterium]